MALPPALAKAAAIDADVRTGTIQDVEHVVNPDAGEPQLRPLFRDHGGRARLRRPLHDPGA